MTDPSQTKDDSTPPAVTPPSVRLRTNTIRARLDEDKKYGRTKVTIEKVEGDMALVTIEETLGRDGYFNELRQAIKAGATIATELGLLMCVTRSRHANTDARCINHIPPRAQNREEIPRQCVLVVREGTEALTRANFNKLLHVLLTTSTEPPRTVCPIGALPKNNTRTG